MDMVVFSREPSSFMGSRVPYHTAARDSFITWKTHGDGNLVRAALRAEAYFDDRIRAATAEEKRRLEGYPD